MRKLLLTAAALAVSATVAQGAPLRLGMAPEPFLPFSEIDAGGNWTGFEGDLSKAICDKLPEKCEIKQMSWEGLIPSLTENKVDAVIGAFSITDARKQVINFSTPYYEEGVSLFGSLDDGVTPKLVAAADGSGEVLSPEGLEGKVIGVQNASVQTNYLKAYVPDIEVKSYDTADNALADLAAGRIDYVFIADLVTRAFAQTPQGEGFGPKIKIPPNITMGQGIGYGFRKDDTASLDEVNKAFAELEADGTVAALRTKWFGAPQ